MRDAGWRQASSLACGAILKWSDNGAFSGRSSFLIQIWLKHLIETNFETPAASGQSLVRTGDGGNLHPKTHLESAVNA